MYWMSFTDYLSNCDRAKVVLPKSSVRHQITHQIIGYYRLIIGWRTCRLTQITKIDPIAFLNTYHPSITIFIRKTSAFISAKQWQCQSIFTLHRDVRSDSRQKKLLFAWNFCLWAQIVS